MRTKELRNLRRWYLIDHSLAKYNKRNEPITKQQLSILLAIHFSLSSSPVVKTFTIMAHLCDHKKAIRADTLSTQLKELIRIGLIEREAAGRSFMYHLTIDGALELAEIEKLNRMCRR